MKLFKSILFSIVVVIIACGESTPKKDGRNNDRRNDDEVEVKDERIPDKEDKIILFFGNSLSAGYGLKEGQSFPDRIQDMIDSLDYKYTVVNAGISGETTAGGAGRIDWVLNQDIDIFVLELGGNDLLRGIDVKNTEENLKEIIEKVQAKDQGIQIILAGMQAPPNMGSDYTDQFAALYPRLAKNHNTALIPFLLDKVGCNPKLNQPDGIHPNIEGARIVAATVWETLDDYLK